MAISILIRYLQQPNHDYLEGVALYNEYGYNSTLKHLFSLGDTIYNKQKLLQELQLIADAGKSIAAVKKVSHTPEIATKKTTINVAELPQELRQLNIKKGELYQEMSFNHSQLIAAKTNAERAELRTEILKADAEIKDIWKQLEHWQETKSFLVEPEPVKEIALNIGKDEAFKRLLNVRANISKLKKNPKRAEDLAKLETEKVELETILGK